MLLRYRCGRSRAAEARSRLEEVAKDRTGMVSREVAAQRESSQLAAEVRAARHLADERHPSPVRVSPVRLVLG